MVENVVVLPITTFEVVLTLTEVEAILIVFTFAAGMIINLDSLDSDRLPVSAKVLVPPAWTVGGVNVAVPFETNEIVLFALNVNEVGIAFTVWSAFCPILNIISRDIDSRITALLNVSSTVSAKKGTVPLTAKMDFTSANE